MRFHTRWSLWELLKELYPGGSQRDVVYRIWDQMRGGGGVADAGSQPMSTAVHTEPKQTLRSNSIFTLWWYPWRKHRGGDYWLCRPFKGYPRISWLFVQQASGQIFKDDMTCFSSTSDICFMVVSFVDRRKLHPLSICSKDGTVQYTNWFISAGIEKLSSHIHTYWRDQKHFEIDCFIWV